MGRRQPATLGLQDQDTDSDDVLMAICCGRDPLIWYYDCYRRLAVLLSCRARHEGQKATDNERRGQLLKLAVSMRDMREHTSLLCVVCGFDEWRTEIGRSCRQ